MAESDEKEKQQPSEADNPEAVLPETESADAVTDSRAESTEYVDLGQKVVDITLGAAVLTGELTVQAARYLVEQGPEFLNTLEAKGRPVREQIDSWLKSGFSQPFQEAARTDSDEDEETEDSAEDEISALERRVRELERQITTSPTDASVPVTPVAPDLDDDPVATTPTSEIVVDDTGKTE